MDALRKLVDEAIDDLITEKPQLDKEEAREQLVTAIENQIYTELGIDPCYLDFDALEKQDSQLGQLARIRRVLVDMRPVTFNDAAWEVAGVLAGAN